MNTFTKLRNMLLSEIDTLKGVRDVSGRNPTDVLLSIKFDDGHIHTIFPKEDVARQLVESAASGIDYSLSGAGSRDDFRSKIPNRIIFHNRQAIGDILMMTCAIRDFKKAFPDVRVKVMTTAMHIWDNNPYLDWTPWDREDIIDFHDASRNQEAIEKAIKEDKAAVIYIGPSRGTNESNRRDRHFANAYRLSIQDNLGIHFDQGPIRPDIWLTEEEYNAPPLIEGHYWIIVAGEKGDWTAKTYPFNRWQTVVDALPELTFVQIGSKAHKHPSLKGKNVINMVGQTEGRTDGIRKLFNLFLNADGSAGLVSFQMHLAGAFNKPCVVVAGAREPVWFTRYPGQRYLSTDGCLPCTVDSNGMPTACWYCSLERCPHLVEEPNSSIKAPACVSMITPEHIVDAIKSYYRGGRLSLTENKKQVFRNIAKEKHDCSTLFEPIVSGKSISELPRKYGMEFGGGSITDKDWEFMLRTVKKHNVKRVLEFGAGLSTLLMLDEGLNVTTYETQEAWINKIKAFNPKADVRLWDGKNFPDPISKYDMVFVDGPAGGINREVSTKIASESSDIVIIHDAGREYERKWQEKYIKPTFRTLIKGGHRCHLWLRDAMPSVVAPVIKNTKGSVRILFNGRGDGGAERSVTWIANTLASAGYAVTYHSPTEKPCATFQWHGSKSVKFEPLDKIFDPCDILLFYVNDWCWELDSSNLRNFFSKPLSAKRKVMCLNYHLGGAGKAEWTRNWDLYLFLNSKLESELLARNPGVRTKVLAPPIANLSEFFKIRPSYSGKLNIVRHSSQGDAKYPRKSFNQMVSAILANREDATISLMPAPSFLKIKNSRLFVHKRNEPPVPEFLSKGNLFWYVLPGIPWDKEEASSSNLKQYTEGGPKVIMEAMASGIPPIAQNHSGMKDRITDETGWRCDHFEQMLEVITNVTSQLLRQKGEAARERARSEFVAERWIEMILDNKEWNKPSGCRPCQSRR